MGKFYGLGVEHKSVARRAVDIITYNGGGKTLGVCCVYAQLVCATRNGVEAYPCAPLPDAFNFVDGMCRATVGGYHLSGTVFVVKFQRQAYFALLGLNYAIKQSHITLFDAARNELPLQSLVR